MSVGAERSRERPKAFADDWTSPGTPRPPTSVAGPLGAAGRVEERPLRPSSVGARYRRYGAEELAGAPSVDGRGGIDLAPDGAEVTFAWDRSGNLEVYAAPLVGDRIIQLTEGTGPSRAPRWSPDARQVAFLRDAADGNGAIWLVDRDGVRERRLTPAAGYGDHTWSPDGSRIAATSAAGEIEVIDVARGEGRTAAAGSQPCWSPDGAWILFTSRGAAGRDLAVVPSAGGEARALATRDGQAGSSSDGRWSPDGSLVAFATTARGRSEIAFAHVRSGAAVRVERCGRTPFEARGPAWRPDGRGVVYRRWTGADVAVRRVFTVSHADDAMADLPGVHFSPLVAPDSESVVAVLSQATRPADVIVRAKGAIEIARVTSSLPAGIDPGALVEPVSVTSATGRTALVYVPHVEAGATRTVVLYAREPEREWDPIAQLLAGRGHVVIAAPTMDPSDLDALTRRIERDGIGGRPLRRVAARPDLALLERTERTRILAELLSGVEGG